MNREPPPGDVLEDVTGVHPPPQDRGAVTRKLFLEPAVPGTREVMGSQFISQLLVCDPALQGFLQLARSCGFHGGRHSGQHVLERHWRAEIRASCTAVRLYCRRARSSSADSLPPRTAIAHHCLLLRCRRPQGKKKGRLE